MWIFDSMVKVPLNRLYLSLVATLGAGFLLLAFFFQLNPLFQPLIYSLAALGVYLVQRKEVRLLRGISFILGSFLISNLLMPDYPFLFSLGFSFLAGKLIFFESIRVWKWLVCGLLFYVGIQITNAWQQIDVLNGFVPLQLSPLLQAAIFSFCTEASLLSYYLAKDSVQSAYESYHWQERSEPARMAFQARDLYEGVKSELRRQHFEERPLEELEEFSEKMIHLCHQLQEMNLTISKIDIASLEMEVAGLKQKIEMIEDPASKKNYQNALINREKQKEQYGALGLQAERIHAQILNYVSALENVRFAYTHRHFSSAEQGTDGIEFLLQMAKNQADNLYETSEAYQKLI